MFRSVPFLAASVVLALAATASADDDSYIFNGFQSDPLVAPGTSFKGDATDRFTYNADGTLTAHYDTAVDSVILFIPLGKHYTQETSFSLTTTITNFIAPPSDFGGQAPAFGLANSVTTGNDRASWPGGDAYDMIAFEYFPTANSGASSSVNFAAIQSGNGVGDIWDRFVSGLWDGIDYLDNNLPSGQAITVTITYDADNKMATLSGDGFNTITADFTDAVFDVDSFAIFLWNDPWIGNGSERIAGDVVFGVAVPEPASLGLLAAGALLMVARRRR